jgi:hypothetical protein
MSFSVSRTSDPFPAPLTPSAPGAGDQRHERGEPDRRHTAHSHAPAADAGDEPRAETAMLRTSSPFVGRLIDVRV